MMKNIDYSFSQWTQPSYLSFKFLTFFLELLSTQNLQFHKITILKCQLPFVYNLFSVPFSISIGRNLQSQFVSAEIKFVWWISSRLLSL